MPAVGGFVFDSSGAPADREVRLYRRDTGDLLDKTRSSGGSAGDPHFDEVTLLLHMDGADGSTTFVDSSAAPKTAIVTGDVQISTAHSKWGGTSCLFGAVGGEVRYSDNTAFGFGTGDFTWEAWIRRQNADCALFDVRNSGSDTGVLVAYISTNGYLSWFDSSAKISTTQHIPVGEWMHVAYSRSSGVLHMFVGGVLVRSDAKSSDFGAAQPLRIGRDVTGGASFSGCIDDLRITKGVARYTADFTPPAARFPDIQGLETTLALGEYYFATNYTGEVQVVCLDDDSAPLENDLIIRTFPV